MSEQSLARQIHTLEERVKELEARIQKGDIFDETTKKEMKHLSEKVDELKEVILQANRDQQQAAAEQAKQMWEMINKREKLLVGIILIFAALAGVEAIPKFF